MSEQTSEARARHSETTIKTTMIATVTTTDTFGLTRTPTKASTITICSCSTSMGNIGDKGFKLRDEILGNEHVEVQGVKKIMGRDFIIEQFHRTTRMTDEEGNNEGRKEDKETMITCW